MPATIASAIALRFFAARIVARHVESVGETRGDLAHLRTFPAIAVAAAAEDDRERAGRGLAEGAQGAFERVGRVRVVDDHVHAVTAEMLHASRNAFERSQPAGARRFVDAQQVRDRDRRERVPHVETPGQMQLDNAARRR